MSARAAIERIVSPGYGCCYRCRRPWRHGVIGVRGHLTPYQLGSSCFPLCEDCWSALPPTERLPYYDELVTNWTRGMPQLAADYDAKRDKIRAAVKAGL